MKSGGVPLARWEGEGGSLATPEQPRSRQHEAALQHQAVKIHVRENGVEVTHALRAHVTRRLALTLGRFADAIDRVVVRFSTAASKRLGERRCQVEVKLRPERLVVEDSADELRAAAEHAMDKVARLVTRALQRDEHTIPSAPSPRLHRAAKP